MLVTALHSGVERSGTLAVFHLMEWLLSADSLAREILRKQLIVCMPVPNPDCYLQGEHGNVYSEWTLDGPRDPASMPEAVAVQHVMDELQPEVDADLHGTALSFDKYIMVENSGAAYSNLSSRCYHREVIRQMDEAALAEGYPSDFQESDAERLFWGLDLDARRRTPTTAIVNATTANRSPS